MAQACAKMHLRTEVRGDDIDVAISVLLESFIQSQKTSIGRVIRKKFSSYISFKEDQSSSLAHLLGKLFKEQQVYLQVISNDQDQTEIKVSLQQLNEAAKEINIFDTTEFLKSDLFKRHFKLRGESIIKDLVG